MKTKLKYPIHKDFKKWAKFNPPLNKFVIFLIQKFMPVLKFGQKSDKYINVKKLKIPFNNKNIKALLYEPKNIEENAPLLIYFHGGGFVLPAAKHHYNNAKKYALGANCKVIFVDYPLSPKNKYPKAINVCFEAYKWAIQNADILGINNLKIAVGGDSAGGNLASVVSLMASDNNIIMPCAQLLIYPAVGSEEKTASMEKFIDTPMCNSRDYEKYCNYYFKSQDDKKERYVSPVRAENYNIYPPTFIEICEFDCLKDEALIYEEELRKAGVKTVLHNVKAVMHGYDIVEKSKITIDSINKRIKFLKEYFK